MRKPSNATVNALFTNTLHVSSQKGHLQVLYKNIKKDNRVLLPISSFFVRVVQSVLFQIPQCLSPTLRRRTVGSQVKLRSL
jgi:hypothetical protein